MAMDRAHFLTLSPALAVAMVCLAAFPPAMHGQTTTALPTELRHNPIDVLRGFEPPVGQEYELGTGDEISISVLGRPELSGKFIIGPDGRVTLPGVGDVEFAGKTRAQAANDAQDMLTKYYQGISVSVGVERYTSNRILLLGAVEHPGLMIFDSTPTLLEVISRGGIAVKSSQADKPTTPSSTVLPTPVNMPELCMIYRGGQAAISVQLRSLLKSGDRLANMRLKRDDVVFIPGDYAYVSVLGNVAHPGLLRLESTSTLTQLLAESGGLGEKSGQYPQIFIIHPNTVDTTGSIETVEFKDILKAKPNRIEFRSGDIIYVSESGFNHVADVLQKVSPLINLVTVGALLVK
jgi:polysaccharide export outer membrane protein